MDEAVTQHWRPTIKGRILVAAFGFGLWALAIETRLVWLQVYRHHELAAWGDNQRQRVAEVAPRRGDIVDRHGRTLALSVDADSIYAVPGHVASPEDTARAVCEALVDCGDEERELFLRRLRQKRAFVYLRRQVGPGEAKRVTDLDLPGIGLLAESCRFYPNRELAAHVLGYVGTDNTGLAGIEQTYDSRIRGREGTILVETDAHQRAFSRVERPPTAGATLELTIDAQLQHIAERELREAVKAERAEGGTIVMMDPHTGEILALANDPTFNPNSFRRSQPDVWRNRGVQEIYEPGSTFKIVTASAAIEERAYTTDEVIDVSAGTIRIGSRLVEDVHRYGPLSFTDVLVKSSNVGAIKIGDRVGSRRLGQYVLRFGFGRRACGDLPGETPGMLSDPARWSAGTLASISMGYEIGVTPVQMVAAVSAVANQGELPQPRVVRAVRTALRRTEITPVTPRRVITADTASQLLGIMEQVVERGTATQAAVPGYTVAGKTGTASKIVNGVYSDTDYHASFVGFVPSRQPALAVLVVIDSPHRSKDRIFGGVVAAPIFSRVATQALRYLRIPPTLNPSPPVLVASTTSGGASDTLGTIEAVAAPIEAGDLDVRTGPPTIPNLRGLGAREAVLRLARLGLVARLSGDGIVVHQDPEPGTPVEQRSSCRLWLVRAPLSAGSQER
ncbi:MAG: penicillin-binding protein [Acidobacteriota bacterium]